MAKELESNEIVASSKDPPPWWQRWYTVLSGLASLIVAITTLTDSGRSALQVGVAALPYRLSRSILGSEANIFERHLQTVLQLRDTVSKGTMDSYFGSTTSQTAIEVRKKKMMGYLYLHKYASIYAQFADEVLIAIVIIFPFEVPKFLDADLREDSRVLEIPTIRSLREKYADNKALVVNGVSATTIGFMTNGLFGKPDVAVSYLFNKAIHCNTKGIAGVWGEPARFGDIKCDDEDAIGRLLTYSNYDTAYTKIYDIKKTDDPNAQRALIVRAVEMNPAFGVIFGGRLPQ